MVNLGCGASTAPLAQVAVALQDHLPLLVPFFTAQVVVVPDEPFGAFGFAFGCVFPPYLLVELFLEVFVKVGDLPTPCVCLVDFLRGLGIVPQRRTAAQTLYDEVDSVVRMSASS